MLLRAMVVAASAAAAKVGTKFEVECRGERMPAEVVGRPFWKKRSARKKD